MTTVSIESVISDYREQARKRLSGGHWFDDDTMQFFRSRLPAIAYVNADRTRAFFVTSEEGPSNIRAWSVRCYSYESGDISTVGLGFQGYTDEEGATLDAKSLALG